MKQIRIARSFITANSLAEVINDEYNFGKPVTCKLFSKLLRTQDNDHYMVIVGDERYVARVYQLGKHLGRQRSDYEYELDWLNFLHEKNLPISYPIARRDGALLGELEAPEGPRFYALFSFAHGRPMQKRNEEQLFVMGQNMAQIHLASNEYKSPYARKPMDLNFLVDAPIARLKEYWEESRVDDLDLILYSAEESRVAIQALIDNEESTEDSWGPIGGDFHIASTFFTAENEPTFFNFDLCGPGWRAYDIASFLQNTNIIHWGSEDYSEAFFAGYYSVRPLSTNEHEAISPFLTIRRIWLTSIFSIEDGTVGHTFIAPGSIAGQYDE